MARAELPGHPAAEEVGEGGVAHRREVQPGAGQQLVTGASQPGDGDEEVQTVRLTRAARPRDLPCPLPELPQGSIGLGGGGLHQGEEPVLVHAPFLEEALPRVVDGEERQDRVRGRGLLRDALGDVVRLGEDQRQVAAVDHALSNTYPRV